MIFPKIHLGSGLNRRFLSLFDIGPIDLYPKDKTNSCHSLSMNVVRQFNLNLSFLSSKVESVLRVWKHSPYIFFWATHSRTGTLLVRFFETLKVSHGNYCSVLVHRQCHTLLNWCQDM